MVAVSLLLLSSDELALSNTKNKLHQWRHRHTHDININCQRLVTCMKFSMSYWRSTFNRPTDQQWWQGVVDRMSTIKTARSDHEGIKHLSSTFQQHRLLRTYSFKKYGIIINSQLIFTDDIICFVLCIDNLECMSQARHRQPGSQMIVR